MVPFLWGDLDQDYEIIQDYSDLGASEELINL